MCGHGTGSQGLVLEKDRGQEHLVSTQALSDLFRLFAEQVKCVVLNACYSQVQAEAISQHINYVIGMRQEIIDQAAIAFSVGFYDALGAGRDIPFAYNLGCNAIQLEIAQSGNSRKANPVITGNQPPPLPTHLIPVLYTKETLTIFPETQDDFPAQATKEDNTATKESASNVFNISDSSITNLSGSGTINYHQNQP